jgi:hypothetical protein
MGVWLAILLFCCMPALAWNTPTHMVTASVAYSTLREQHPAALAKAVALLKAHPEYVNWAKHDLPDVPAEERDRYLLMLAARWADDIKTDRGMRTRYKAYNHPEWHYINYPYTPGTTSGWTAPAPNIVTGYAAELKVLAAPGTAARRAIALCWVLHLIGDAHCPLHAISLINADYPAPTGDKGGNGFYVKTKAENRSAMNLHSLWDGPITGSDRFKNVRDHGTALMAILPLAQFPAAQDTRLEWILKNETYPAAVQHAYLNGTLKGSTAASENAPVLPEGYLQNAKAVAEKRVTLAGYRMARVIALAVK